MTKRIALYGFLVCVIVFGMALAPTSNAYISTHFGEDFNGTNGNWQRSNGWSNGGMFNCGWLQDHVTFSGGIMTLRLDKYASSGKPYSSGEYRTVNQFTYGMYQVRMQPAKNIGIVSSFFTYTGSPWDEIDIEFLGKNTTQVQFNYFTNGQGGHEYVYNLGFDASQGYHTYGFDWEPGYIAWYVDGRQVYKATNNIPSHPGQIYVNLWNGTGVDSWLGAYNGANPLYARYDWVSYK